MVSTAAVIYSLFFIECLATVLAYFGNLYSLTGDNSLRSTPIYSAFASNPVPIFVGFIVNICCSATNIVDLLFDFAYYPKISTQDDEIVEHDSWTERAFLLFTNIFTCFIVLSLYKDENVPFLYSCFQGLQYLGSTATVFLLSNKLEPVYFCRVYVISAYSILSLACLTSVIGFAHGPTFWANILSMIFDAIFVLVVSALLVPWLWSLRMRITKGSKLTTSDICCLWYCVSTVAVIFIVPGIMSLKVLFDWSQYNDVDVCIFVYSFAAYSVIVSSVPGRLAKAAADKERRHLIGMKTTLIRHISHEVRSPLNIINSGINFMETDISTLPPGTLKEKVMESLVSVRHACIEVIQTLNDILQMETIKSGHLAFEQQMVPCIEIVETISQYGIAAKEKGVLFSVHQSISSSKWATQDMDIESSIGSAREEQKLSNMNHLSLFVDKFKIVQVMRNLITNAVKFTPSGRSVTVNIRPATLADATEANPRPLENKRLLAANYSETFFSEYEFVSNVVIEVVDTGAGIASENQSKVFGAFAQFQANELQGGGGTGLGLWISQEIMKKHGSLICFRSEGEGSGATFSFIVGMFQLSPLPLLRNIQKPVVDRMSDCRRVFPDHASTQHTLLPFFESTHRTRKVLVVDDSLLNVKVMVRIIRQFHESVHADISEANDGTVAVELIRAAALEGAPFDIVFMDNVMTLMNGPEAAELMRSDGYMGLIVGVTGNVLPRDVLGYLAAGANHVLPKPIEASLVGDLLSLGV